MRIMCQALTKIVQETCHTYHFPMDLERTHGLGQDWAALMTGIFRSFDTPNLSSET